MVLDQSTAVYQRILKNCTHDGSNPMAGPIQTSLEKTGPDHLSSLKCLSDSSGDSIIYTLLPPVFKGLNTTFKEFLILTGQKAIHSKYDGIIELKVGARNSCFLLMEQDQEISFPDEDPKLRYLNTLTSGLGDVLYTNQHADINIVVDQRIFPCHKVILAAMSPYFDAMFTHDMRESRDGIVTLHDIDADIFDNILHFMYTGKDVVCEENAEKMFRAASLMQIPCLQESCAAFLLSQISHDNSIGIWKIAKAHNCKKLSDKAWQTILENFQMVSASEDFASLDLDELLCIIQDDSLISPSEEFVCDVALDWVAAEESRKDCLCQLIPALRLPLVSSDYLFHMIDSHTEVQGDPACRKVIQEAMKYHACFSKRQNFTSSRCVRRLHSKMDDVLVVIGGLLSTTPRYQTTKEVLCYSFQQRRWYYLPSLPYDPGYEFATCVHNNSLYVSGGWLKLTGMAEYKSHKNEWKVCETLTNGRCGHVMVAVSNSIFVLGGRDGRAPAMTNIEEFNINTEKWSMAGDLLLGVRSTSACAIGERIFIFGGITETDKDTMSVQCFDARHHNTSIIGDLPFTCRLTRTVSLDSSVYVMAPDGRMLEFCDPSLSIISHTQSKRRSRCDSSSSVDSMADPPSPTSTTVTLGNVLCRIPNFSQHHFEVIQHKGEILLVGGKTPDNTILKNIMAINIDSKPEVVVEDILEMPSARWCFGCVKTSIKRDYLNNQIP
ncbi:hypothetical protein FSP39_020855 [Pinctada imbricata]|uniref:BTB domain-containing protein n=1 Tax=Pinctada imbricata TaxID=66713 RepID=A0AA88Y029_PINIB|nr:hypothetical protein FSP39_020855 [Pinctada imbricata]